MGNATTKVAAVAMHSVMGDFSSNLASVSAWCHQARDQGAEFALFPEECITGSLNKSDLDFDAARQIVQGAELEAVPLLEALCRKLRMTVIVGTIEPAGERFANSALIIDPHGHVGTFTKLHLPNEIERNWFVEGDRFPVITSQGWTLAVGICYDLRFPEIFRTAAQNGADFFVLPVGGSGGYPGPTGDQREQIQLHKKLAMQLLPARAVDNALYVFYANQAGQSGDAYFPGFTLAVDPEGNLVDEYLQGEGMSVTEICRSTIQHARQSICCTTDEVRPAIYATVKKIGVSRDRPESNQ